jgi:hypothetical protein
MAGPPGEIGHPRYGEQSGRSSGPDLVVDADFYAPASDTTTFT